MRKYNEKKKLAKNSQKKKYNNLIGKEYSNPDSMENNEMIDNLIKMTGNEDVYHELKTETNKIKQLLSHSKERLNNIDLYEKINEDIDIYQWNNLFNQSIPITSYVTSSKLINNQNNQKKEIKKDIDEKLNKKIEKYPVALVDLTDEEIKKYLPPHIANIPPSQVIRFQQIPFKGNSKDAFYFSNAFNDYYKMDFKEFLKRMPILRAKKRCKSANLKAQIKIGRKKDDEEEEKRGISNNEMLNKLNNLYIEKQYLSLSINSNNIQPLMSSIHSQIYPGEGDELTKRTKIYTKTNKPLGSERDVYDIDFTVNQRHYHRNMLNNIKLTKRRSKSAVRTLNLSKYDANDPDIAIFKRIEVLEKMINEKQGNIGKQLLKMEKEEEKSINIGRNKENEKVNINDKNEKKLTKDETPFEKIETYKNNINSDMNRQRSMSVKKYNKRLEEITNVNNKQNKNFPRAMSAQVMRPIDKQNEYYVHNVYLSSKNKLRQHNIFLKGKRNKLNEIFDENKKGNSSSQISTYDGINNSISEKKNVPTYAFPIKNNHEIPNKMYLKINNILKGKQYEKDQKKLEEFTKLIQLDDAFLYEEILKNNGKTNIDSMKYLDKNKIFNRPLSSNLNKNLEILKKLEKNAKICFKKIQYPKTVRNTKNNFRFSSKKSSNENSKIEFTTSLPNKQEFYMNNKNDKVTFIYFNDVIEMKPQKLSDLKPIIKNDGIIIPSNYFNRGKPQLLDYHKKIKLNNDLQRVLSDRTLGETPKKRDNIIIQEEHLEMFKKKKIVNSNSDNKIKRKRIFSANYN